MRWLGQKLVIWGGMSPISGDWLRSGSVYDPVTDAWTPMDLANAPESPTNYSPQAVGVTVDAKLVVVDHFGVGAAFDPVANRWYALKSQEPTPPESAATAVTAWNGAQLFLWGGSETGPPDYSICNGRPGCDPPPTIIPITQGFIYTAAW